MNNSSQKLSKVTINQLSLGAPQSIVVWFYDTFDNNFGITDGLEERRTGVGNVWYNILPKLFNTFAWIISSKSSDIFWHCK